MSEPRRHPTRALTEGAVLAALTVIVAAVGVIAPIVGFLLAPLPIMLLVIRWGPRIAVLASVVAAMLLLQFFGPVIAAPIVAAFVPLGLALGWGVRRGLAAQLTILAGAAATLCASVAMLAGFSGALHQDPVGELIQLQAKATQSAAAIQLRLGMPPDQIEEMRAMWVSFCSEHQCFTAVGPSWTRATLPAGLAFSALLWAYLCYAVARATLRRVGHELPGVPPILAWRIHPLFASVLFWSTAALTLLSLRFPRASGAALNAGIAILMIFAFQGALVGITWMNRWRISRFAQVVAGILLLRVAGVSFAALVMVGLLDTWFDYRRPEIPAAPISPSVNPGETLRNSSAAAAAPAGRVSQSASGGAAAGQDRGASARRKSRQTGDRVKVVRRS